MQICYSQSLIYLLSCFTLFLPCSTFSTTLLSCSFFMNHSSYVRTGFIVASQNLFLVLLCSFLLPTSSLIMLKRNSAFLTPPQCLEMFLLCPLCRCCYTVGVVGYPYFPMMCQCVLVYVYSLFSLLCSPNFSFLFLENLSHSVQVRMSHRNLRILLFPPLFISIMQIREDLRTLGIWVSLSISSDHA